MLGGFCVLSMKNAQTQSGKLSNEYVPSVGVATNVERTSLRIMYNVRGYSFTYETAYLEEAKKDLEKLNGYLKEAVSLGNKYASLGELKKNAEIATTKVDEYVALLNETEVLIKGLESEKVKLNDNAKVYMDNCYTFLSGQEKSLNSEINSGVKGNKLKERYKKIEIVSSIIDIGNASRLAMWQAQALRDPQLIQGAQANFAKMDSMFAELRNITNQAVDIKQIEETKKAAEGYKAAMNSFLDKWNQLQDLGKKRGEIAEQVLKAAQNTSESGMKDTQGSASGSAIALAASSGLMIVGLITAVGIGSFLAFIIVLGITKPIKQCFNRGRKRFGVGRTLFSGCEYERYS